MSKRPIPPPPGDKPVPTAPPPPPAWRHWLWPAALLAALVLYSFLPAIHGSKQVNLTYSQFLSDVYTHKVSTFTLANASTNANATASGTLTNGHDYTTVVPGLLAGSDLAAKLTAGNVKITATPPSSSTGAELLSWLILLAPLIFVFYLFRRMSRGAASPMGVLGIGRSRAKIFDAERPQT